MNSQRLKQVVDGTIITVVVLGTLYYLPKLHHGVQAFVEKESGNPEWQPSYAHAVYLLGMVPLVGSALMLVPCLSFFHPPMSRTRRRVLLICCFVPLTLAALGARAGPDDLVVTVLGLGALFSLGLWLFALPAVLKNISILDVVARLGRNP